MTMPGDALLQEVFSHPDQDEPRQVYADWLDEQGETDRAAFIRVQLALAKMAEDDPDRPALEDQEHALLAQHEARWLGDWPARIPEWGFQRGFLAWLRTDTETLLAHGDALFSRHPLTRLKLERPSPYELGPIEALGERPWLSRLQRLRTGVFPELLQSPHLIGLRELECSGDERDPEVIDLVLRCPSLCSLQKLALPGLLLRPWLPWLRGVLEQAPLHTLKLGDCEVDAESLGALLGAARTSLRSLGLRDNPLQASAWEVWKDGPPKALQRLDLSGTDLAGAGLAALLALPAMSGLVSLALGRGTVISVRDLRAMAGSPFWSQAEELHLNSTPCPADELGYLCGPGATDRLKILDLGSTWTGTEGVRRLCEAPFADTLVSLDLSNADLDDEALSLMADSGRFVRLRRLRLAGNRLSDQGVVRLARSPSLARLRHLDLVLTSLTTRGLEAVLERAHWSLSGLRLGHDSLDSAMIEALARSPRLARLTELRLGGSRALSGRGLLPLAESPHLSPLCRLRASTAVAGEVQQALRARLGRRWT